jgi:hypothetical protein
MRHLTKTDFASVRAADQQIVNKDLQLPPIGILVGLVGPRNEAPFDVRHCSQDFSKIGARIWLASGIGTPGGLRALLIFVRGALRFRQREATKGWRSSTAPLARVVDHTRLLPDVILSPTRLIHNYLRINGAAGTSRNGSPTRGNRTVSHLWVVTRNPHTNSAQGTERPLQWVTNQTQLHMRRKQQWFRKTNTGLNTPVVLLWFGPRHPRRHWVAPVANEKIRIFICS